MSPDVYRRPAKPLRVDVRRREQFAPPGAAPLPEIVAVNKATECHVTPPDVAARMVDYLDARPDMLTLEPSAGTGNLSRALIEAGHSRFELCQVERHVALAARLRSIGPVINRCFLDYAEEARGKVEFPRVIMNPPFRHVQQHVAAARSLMGRNGHDCPPVLVALVPVTFNDPAAEELETLPPDTFATARVHTKLIRIVGA